MLELLDNRPKFAGAPNGVDRSVGHGVIRGVILAEKGVFANEWRGEFTDDSLADIVDVIQSEGDSGLKARWTHPDASNDGLGTYLGRWRNPRIDDGKVRADLHFAKLATQPSPDHGGRDFASYLMDRADEDPKSFECSLHVTKAKKVYRRTDEGELEKNDDGTTKPPIWRVEGLRACDVVDKGDATHSGFLTIDADDFLSPRNHNAISRRVKSTLDSMFADYDREETESRLNAFVNRYLSNRFQTGETDEPEETMTKENQNPTPAVDENKLRTMVTETVKEQLQPFNDSITKLTELVENSDKESKKDRRAREITALCTVNGYPEKASEFINDENLSTGEVAMKLLALNRENNKLTTGDGEPTSDEEQTLAREYDENATMLSRMGINREEYIRSNSSKPTPKPQKDKEKDKDAA